MLDRRRRRLFALLGSVLLGSWVVAVWTAVADPSASATSDSSAELAGSMSPEALEELVDHPDDDEEPPGAGDAADARDVAVDADVAPPSGLAASEPTDAGVRQVVTLIQQRSHDRLELAFDANGALVQVNAQEIVRFFSSWRGGPIHVDEGLLELLGRVSAAFDGAPIIMVSGHRDPGRGTSQKSYHVKGMAADIFIDGVQTKELHAKAIELGARGAGLYPYFVHVDVRDAAKYKWTGGRWPRRNHQPPRAGVPWAPPHARPKGALAGGKSRP